MQRNLREASSWWGAWESPSSAAPAPIPNCPAPAAVGPNPARPVPPAVGPNARAPCSARFPGGRVTAACPS
eukprot:5789055-Pyramimonas_sp.AAC.1